MPKDELNSVFAGETSWDIIIGCDGLALYHTVLTKIIILSIFPILQNLKHSFSCELCF